MAVWLVPPDFALSLLHAFSVLQSLRFRVPSQLAAHSLMHALPGSFFPLSVVLDDPSSEVLLLSSTSLPRDPLRLDTRPTASRHVA